MITNRRTVQVKQGRMEEYAAMILAEAQHAKIDHGFRLYTSDIGTLNQLVLEIDFANLAAYDQFWREWVSIDPATFDERYQSLVEHDIANEIWDLTI